MHAKAASWRGALRHILRATRHSQRAPTSTNSRNRARAWNERARRADSICSKADNIEFE